MHSLSPVAVGLSDLIEREHKEESHAFRNEFQRDRDRIIHCNAFRRLEYKTQVFVNHLGDNYRTRLTHSIEVAQIARTVARALALNEDLVETLALAHDLGHPPFGHAGEAALNHLVKPEDGFDHNAQTLRVVTYLENRYPNFRGLNLTQATRLGLQKHTRLPEGMGHTIEAMVVDLSDEIAYTNHDVDDGLDSGYITLPQLDSVPLWKDVYSQSAKKYPQVSEKIRIRTSIRLLINEMVIDLINTIEGNLKKHGINTLQDVLASREKLVSFSPPMTTRFAELKRFLFRNLYRHAEVVKLNKRAESVLSRIYHFLVENTGSMPNEYRARISAGEKTTTVVCDFIAGMTDRYALQWNKTVLGLDA